MRFCIIFLTLLLLISCIDVESTIELNSDRSGTFFLTYKISKMALNIGRAADEKRLVLLPVSGDEVQQAAAQISGLTLNSFSLKEKASEITVDLSGSFNDIDALSELFALYSESTISLNQESGNSLYSQIIYTEKENPMNAETAALFGKLIPGYALSFVLTAPEEIISAELVDDAVTNGSIDIADSRLSVNLHLSASDVIRENKTIKWEVNW